ASACCPSSSAATATRPRSRTRACACSPAARTATPLSPRCARCASACRRPAPPTAPRDGCSRRRAAERRALLLLVEPLPLAGRALLREAVEDRRDAGRALDRLVEAEDEVRRLARAEDLRHLGLHEAGGLGERVLGLAPRAARAERRPVDDAVRQ